MGRATRAQWETGADLRNKNRLMLKVTPPPAVVKWYRARDVFLGLNGNAKPNYRRGLELAQECKAEPGCEEAAWFCGLCEAVDSPFILDDENSDDDEYRENPHKDIPFHSVSHFFRQLSLQPGMSHTKDGGRLTGLYAILMLTANGNYHTQNETVFALLSASAAVGYPLAMCHLAIAHIRQGGRDHNWDKARWWARRAADLGEPHGMWLVCALSEAATPETAAWAERASALEYHSAQLYVGTKLPRHDPRHMYLLYKAAEAGESTATFFDTVLIAANMRPHDEYSRAMFQVGSCLAAAKREGQPDPECPLDYPIDACMVLNCSVNLQIEGVFRTVVWHYERCCHNARVAVNTWTLLARRRKPGTMFEKVCADVRKLISERVWACRVTWHEWEGP